MENVINILIEYPILTLFVVIGLGYVLGELSIFGFRFGVAGVLFVGLAVGALHPKIALPEVIPTLGLIIFVYAIGIHSGPALAAIIRQRGYRDSVFAVAILLFAAGLAYGLAWTLGLSGARTSGLFCGALTNTPALAAAREAVRDQMVAQGQDPEQARLETVQPVIAYSIAYPIGVIGVLICLQVFRKLWRVESKPFEDVPEIHVQDFVVRNPGVAGRTVGDVLRVHKHHGFVISRIRHDGDTDIATSDTVLDEGDIVAVVGDEEALDRAQQIFGEPSEAKIEEDRSELDYRRVFVSAKEVVGERIGDLDLQNRLKATITRLRRGDVDVVPTPDTRLEFGDRIRVLTHRDNFPAVSRFFGDSIRGAAEMDFGSVALGLVLGVLVGMLPIPLPGGNTLKLGLAGGPLLVALALGKLERTGRISWVIPVAANLTLRQIGLLLFLAGVGTRAGYEFVQTLQNTGFQLLWAGAIVTFGVTFATLIVGYKVLKMPYDFLAGLMSGIQTQPAALAFAANQAKSDEPNLGYASVYPAATIAKIILAQLLVGWPVAQGAEPPSPPPPAPVTRPSKVATKLIRPGVSGVATMPPAGGALVSFGFSREPSGSGIVTSGLTAFYEYVVTDRLGVLVVPTHYLGRSGKRGIGDTSLGLKYILRRETAHLPTLSAAYMMKQPTARTGLGSGELDHKATLYADKNAWGTRFTGNFITRFEGVADGTERRYMGSLGILRPVAGNWGVALQSYYSLSSLRNGGVIAAPTYHITPTLAVSAGLEHGFGPGSPGLGFVAGVTYMHRPAPLRATDPARWRAGGMQGASGRDEGDQI